VRVVNGEGVFFIHPYQFTIHHLPLEMIRHPELRTLLKVYSNPPARAKNRSSWSLRVMVSSFHYDAPVFDPRKIDHRLAEFFLAVGLFDQGRSFTKQMMVECPV